MIAAIPSGHAADRQRRCRIGWLALVAASLLCACSVQSSRRPDLNSEASITRVLTQLSPWADGSPDRSNDGRTPPEPGSDRALLINWFARYAANETFGQHERDYQPMPLPSSVGAALSEERAYEADEAKKEAAQHAAESEKAHQEESARNQAAAEASRAGLAAAAQQVVVQRQAEAQYEQDQQQKQQNDAARLDCVQRRQDAALNAPAADYHRVWDSFPVCERMPDPPNAIEVARNFDVTAACIRVSSSDRLVDSDSGKLGKVAAWHWTRSDLTRTPHLHRANRRWP